MRITLHQAYVTIMPGPSGKILVSIKDQTGGYFDLPRLRTTTDIVNKLSELPAVGYDLESVCYLREMLLAIFDMSLNAEYIARFRFDLFKETP